MSLSLVEHHDEVASTNDLALARIRSGCEHGWAVCAARQTAGRGRHGRSWLDLGGAQLFLSVAVLGLPRTSGLTRLPLAAGVGVAHAIERLTGLHPGLKWPNDIWLDGQKVGGILCEAAFDGSRLLGAVVGIGLNLEAPAAGMPADLDATALGAHAEVPDREAVATTVRYEVLRAAEALVEGTSVLDAWRERDVLAGRAVLLPDGTAAVARGIADDGALRAERSDGTLTSIVAGDVRVRPLDDPTAG